MRSFDVKYTTIHYGKKIPEKNEPDSGIGAISPPTLRSSLSYLNTRITTTDEVRRQIGFPMSSTTSLSTTKTRSSPYSYFNSVFPVLSSFCNPS